MDDFKPGLVCEQRGGESPVFYSVVLFGHEWPVIALVVGPPAAFRLPRPAQLAVVVLDAPTPFAVQLVGGEINPADAVRAAEALFVTQNTALSSPPSSAPPTT